MRLLAPAATSAPAPRRASLALVFLSVLVAVVVMTAGPGCALIPVRLDNVARLERAHPQGLPDAIQASPEAAEFVRDALKTINRLEADIERR